MTHRYNETSQKIQPRESLGMQTPERVAFTPKDPKIIKYAGGVQSASGERGGLVFSRPNVVKKYQQLFQSGDPAVPIYLKRGRSDQLIYKGLMIGSIVGLTISFFGLYRMALPPRK